MDMACLEHPSLSYVMCCQQCELPVCTNCIAHKHKGHTFQNIRNFYRTKIEKCTKQLRFLKEEILTKCKDTESSVEAQKRECTNHFSNIRSSVLTRANKIKEAVDEVLSEILTTVDKAESDTYNQLTAGGSKVMKHICHLQDTIGLYEKHMQETDKPALFLLFCKKNKLTDFESIPQVPKVQLPKYSENPISFEGLTKQFGLLQVRETDQVYEYMTMEKANQAGISGEENTNATLLGHLPTPGLESCHHISHVKSGKVWISDHMGNLTITDSSRKKLKSICCSGGYGFHCGTKKGTLLLANHKKNQITEIQADYSSQVLFSTGEWSPLCIHCSKRNGDLLIGMKNNSKGCVTRYDKRGRELQRIFSTAEGKTLYSEPFYITENKNGDICTSDWYQEALVVVNKSGCHRFSYRGTDGTKLCPGGVCTDKRGHILLYEASSSSVHLISQDGVLLDIIIHLTTGFPFTPQGMDIDESHNLWVGTFTDESCVKVFKYTYLKNNA